MRPQAIHIRGAREHNLKELELQIPRDKLVVITGVSGSGKSSLAFDTLYAEGYRQYLDSLSPRVRGVLDQLPRPEVDFIHGLSPVIAIEQCARAGGGPRATVATATQIDAYARLLWTHAGEARCPIDGTLIVPFSLDDCLERLFREAEGAKALILAPLFRAKVSVIREEIPRLRQRGYQRVRLDGEVVDLDAYELLAGRKGELQLDLVVDRLTIKPEARSRLSDSLELAFREGERRALVLVETGKGEAWREIALSQHLACMEGHPYDPLTPKHFSPNYPEGACPVCGGLGETLRFDPELLVPDGSKSVKNGALKPLRFGSKNMIIRHNALLRQLAEQLPFEADCAWKELPETVREALLYGAGKERLFRFRFHGGKASEPQPFEGVLALLERMFVQTSSKGLRARLMAFQVRAPCCECGGTGLNARAKAVRVNGESVDAFMARSVEGALDFVRSLKREGGEAYVLVREALTRLEAQLDFLMRLGLGYLGLRRPYASLSGGEAQRVRLATQLGVGLTGVAYILDEPSIGLHPADHEKLVGALLELRDRGNAVIVVEHDEATMRRADHLIELGPGAGEAGGRLLFEGDLEACLASERSRTGAYLSGRLAIQRDASQREPGKAWVRVREAREHNLQGIDVDFPVGLLTVVCGVSGSGKSSLVNGILACAAARKLQRAKALPGAHGGIEGLELFRNAVQVDQSPIGRTPRSNPATYVKLFDPLRQLFAKCPLARVRGYSASRFSFNTRGGRCERCQGDGQIKLDMHFLDDVYVCCPSCGGRRYNRETLEVRFKGHSIADVLEMSVTQAREVFRNQPAIAHKLELLDSVGLGYVRLGQPAQTLSGGEAQRIKLALELSKRTQGETLYLLDEPTTGLHWDDVQKLMDLLFRLREAGNTVVLIEHHLDVIRLADWLIELGPGGGEHGGGLVYAGVPEGIRGCPDSPTGRCLC